MPRLPQRPIGPRCRQPGLLGTALLALALCAAHPGWAKEKNAKAKTAKTSKIVKSPQPYDSSGESRSERERRLLRECKGRVNAGACAGYTG